MYSVLETNVKSVLGVNDLTDFLYYNSLPEDKEHIFSLLKDSDDNHDEWQYFIFKTSNLKYTCVYLLTTDFEKQNRTVGIMYCKNIDDLIGLFTYMSRTFILNIHLGPYNLFKGNFYSAVNDALIDLKSETQYVKIINGTIN